MENNISQADILMKAKELYYQHIGFDEALNHFLWGQASREYQQAWVTIARIDLEDNVCEE